MSREHLKEFFRTDLHAIIQNTIRDIAAELRYPANEREVTLLTKVYVGALAGMMEDWLLGEIQESPEALIQFVDQLLKDHVRGAALRLMGETPASKLPGG